MNLTLTKMGLFHDPLVDIVWAINSETSEVVAIPNEYSSGYPAALTAAIDAGLVEETETAATPLPSFDAPETWTLTDTWGEYEIVGIPPLTTP